MSLIKSGPGQTSYVGIFLHKYLCVLCTHHCFPPEGERWDTYRKLDNFEKLRSTSPPLGQYVVSKILWMGHQISYIILSGNFRLCI